MIKIKEWEEKDRPIEKLLSVGAVSLSVSELIAIIIGSGTKELNAVSLAREILKDANNDLNTLRKFTIQDFKKHKGIGQSKGVKLLALFELFRRIEGQKGETNTRQILSSNEAAQIISPYLRDLDHEECWVIFLNRANKIITKERMSSGGLSSTIVDVKMIIKKSLEKMASAIILVHNHPSGNITPGEHDIIQTKKVKEATKICDISLLDHIIVGNGEYYSFADNGKIL